MGDYQIHYLKRDGSSTKVIPFQAASDTEAKAYVIDYHGRRPTELWREGRLVHRRVSPRFLAAGGEIYPSCCRWAPISSWGLETFARSNPPLSDAEFNAIGRHSTAVLEDLGSALAPHGVWLWAIGHGPPPCRPRPRQAVRYTSSPYNRYEGVLTGADNCSVFSDVRDGADVVADLCGLLDQTLDNAFTRLGLLQRQTSLGRGSARTVEVEGELCKAVVATWKVETARIEAKA